MTPSSQKKQKDDIDRLFEKDKRFVFMERSAHESGFSGHFQEKIRPILLQLESLRLKKVRTLFIRVFGAILLLFIGGSFLIPDHFQYTQQIYFIGFVLAILWAAEPYRTYRSIYKELIMPHIVSYFSSFSYNRQGKIPPEELIASDILPPHTSYTSEDMIEGRRKGAYFRIAETRLHNKKDKNYLTKNFKGIFVLIEMPFSFDGITIFRKDLGLPVAWKSGNTAGKKRLKLKKDKYARRFSIYTTSEKDAKSLACPEVMDIILLLSKTFRNTLLQCSFYQNKIFITIPCNRNLFEPSSVFQPAYNVNDLRLILAEISILFDLADEMEKIPQKIA